MIRKDDRTPEQQKTHYFLVIGTDSFMSGWGQAEHGASFAAWACTPEDAPRVKAWVAARSEMKRVRTVYDNGPGGTRYRPGRSCAHLHIYVVTTGHPSLGSVGSFGGAL